MNLISKSSILALKRFALFYLLRLNLHKIIRRFILIFSTRIPLQSVHRNILDSLVDSGFYCSHIDQLACQPACRSLISYGSSFLNSKSSTFEKLFLRNFVGGDFRTAKPLNLEDHPPIKDFGFFPSFSDCRYIFWLSCQIG